MLNNHHRYCLQQLQTVLEVPGDVIECGIGCGDNCIQMAAWLRDLRIKKIVHACDIFEGLPYTDEETSHIKSPLEKGECVHRTVPEFIAETEKYVVQKFINIVPGLVEETLPKILNDKTFCFAWLDMDLYKPTHFAWYWLQDKMPVGAIIGIHDYTNVRCPGIDEIIEDIVMKNTDWEQVYRDGVAIYFKRKNR